MPKEEKIITLPKLMMSANWYPEKQMRELFIAGLRCGVRGFDTAREYKVEAKVGRAIKDALEETGINRKEIFVQTRICNEEIVRGNIKDEVRKSIDKMGLDYLDSFMFHWPTPDYYIDRWKDLISVYENTDRVRSIGMCNCRVRHLQKMKDAEIRVLPQIVQVEVTPFWQINDLKAFCDENSIAIQAFSPLCKMIDKVKCNPTLLSMAHKYDVSIPQIILRWNYQRGIIPISQSGKVERIPSNFNIWKFELSSADMEEIASLDCGYKYHLESATCAGF